MNPDDFQLLDAWRHHELSDEEFQQLEERLREEPDLRAQLRAQSTLEEALTAAAMDQADQADQADQTSETVARHADTPKSVSKTLLPWTLAALTLLATAIAVWHLYPDQKTPSQAQDQTPPPPIAAVLVDDANAILNNSPLTQTTFTENETYHLTSGSLHIRLTNGTDLHAEGPAIFIIKSPLEVHCTSGSLRATVPPAAKGFTISTPNAHFKDLGTDFAVKVDPDSQQSLLHIFEGSVAVLDPTNQNTLTTANAGTTLTVKKDKLDPETTFNPNDFPDPLRIGTLRWRQHRAKLKDHPDLIGYFSFDWDNLRNGILHNIATHGTIPNGTIHNARHANGRWPGKGSLVFDSDDDYVAINIPGDYKELTYTAWLWVDHYNYNMQAILNTDGWGGPAVHWQLDKGGNAWLARNVKKGSKFAPTKFSVPTGQWVHLATSISKSTGKGYEWLNGRLARVQQNPPHEPIQPGSCRLGNWLPNPEEVNNPVRAFRGSIDEFTIWKKILSEKEIKALVQAGRPSALWPASP